MSAPQKKAVIRGIIYACIGAAGLGYEALFGSPPELTVMILYLAIIGIGLITIRAKRG